MAPRHVQHVDDPENFAEDLVVHNLIRLKGLRLRPGIAIFLSVASDTIDALSSTIIVTVALDKGSDEDMIIELEECIHVSELNPVSVIFGEVLEEVGRKGAYEALLFYSLRDPVSFELSGPSDVCIYATFGRGETIGAKVSLSALADFFEEVE